MRAKANEVADAIVRLNDESASADMLKDIEALAGDHTFATQFFYRLRNASQTSGFAVSWLEDRLQKSGMDAEEAMMDEHNRLASGNFTTGNKIGRASWREREGQDE